MPELPELEVIKAILAPRIVGHTVRGAEVSRPYLPQPAELGEHLVGWELSGIARRGLYLVLSFSSAVHLLLHLTPRVWLWHERRGSPSTSATALQLIFDDGSDLRLIEGRSARPAGVWVVTSLSSAAPLQKLGHEPLSDAFTAAALRGVISGTRRPLKALLTDQTLIAGIGDAYADEILFRAKLSPVRYTHTLAEEEIDRLWEAIGETLRWAVGEIAVRAGGALFEREIRDFMRVHGRKGLPCPECGAPIAEILYDAVRTDYCPCCQRAGLSRATVPSKGGRLRRASAPGSPSVHGDGSRPDRTTPSSEAETPRR